MLRYSFYCLLLMLGAFSFAQTRAITDLERIGCADVIVIGTIEEILDQTKSNTSNVVFKATDVAVIHVEKTLKGKVGERIDVTNLPIASPGNVGMLQPGRRMLFFVQQLRDRFMLPYGAPCLRPVQEKDAIDALIQQFPLSVRLTSPNGPCYFGRPVPLIVQISNTGTTPVGITTITLQGFYYSPLMELTLGGGYPEDSPHADPANNTIIEPGKTYTVTLKYQLTQPKSWKDYVPESYLLTRAAIRIRATIERNTPRKSPDDVYIVVSPLTPVLIGFPPPTADLP